MKKLGLLKIISGILLVLLRDFVMQKKKTRPSGKSGGLELTKDSLGCAAREGEVNEPEDWSGVLILCARMSSPRPSPCCICLKLYL